MSAIPFNIKIDIIFIAKFARAKEWVIGILIYNATYLKDQWFHILNN